MSKLSNLLKSTRCKNLKIALLYFYNTSRLIIRGGKRTLIFWILIKLLQTSQLVQAGSSKTVGDQRRYAGPGIGSFPMTDHLWQITSGSSPIHSYGTSLQTIGAPLDVSQKLDVASSLNWGGRESANNQKWTSLNDIQHHQISHKFIKPGILSKEKHDYYSWIGFLKTNKWKVVKRK